MGDDACLERIGTPVYALQALFLEHQGIQGLEVGNLPAQNSVAGQYSLLPNRSVAVQAGRAVVERGRDGGGFRSILGVDKGRTEREHLIVRDKTGIDIPEEIGPFHRPSLTGQSRHIPRNQLVNLMKAGLVDPLCLAHLVQLLVIVPDGEPLSVAHQLAQTEHEVVRLHDDVGHVRGGEGHIHCHCDLGVHVEDPLHQQIGEARSCASGQGTVEDEAAEVVAGLDLGPDFIDDLVGKHLADGVLAPHAVVSSVFLPSDAVVAIVEVSPTPLPYLIHVLRASIDEHVPRHSPSVLGLIKNRVIIEPPLLCTLPSLPIHAVLSRQLLPDLVADLHPCPPNAHEDQLLHPKALQE